MSSGTVKRLLPPEVIKSIDFSMMPIPTVGDTLGGYRIMVKVFYKSVSERISPLLVFLLERYKQKNVCITVPPRDCEDILN